MSQRAPEALPRERASANGDKPKRSRDPVRSKQTILRAAAAEFCQYGFSGARVERIAAKSRSNMRMLYHYFGNKEGLYLAVIESAYSRIRRGEATLDLTQKDAVQAMRTLVGFTFDFFAANKDVLALINGENTLKGRYLRKVPNVKAMTLPLIDSIGGIVESGYKQRQFSIRPDPVQLYVSLVALSQLHILNRYTLSVIFDQDLSDATWLKARRAHVEDMILKYLGVG